MASSRSAVSTYEFVDVHAALDAFVDGASTVLLPKSILHEHKAPNDVLLGSLRRHSTNDENVFEHIRSRQQQGAKKRHRRCLTLDSLTRCKPVIHFSALLRELIAADRTLQERDKDIKLAAEIGTMLLEKNASLEHMVDEQAEEIAELEATAHKQGRHEQEMSALLDFLRAELGTSVTGDASNDLETFRRVLKKARRRQQDRIAELEEDLEAVQEERGALAQQVAQRADALTRLRHATETNKQLREQLEYLSEHTATEKERHLNTLQQQARAEQRRLEADIERLHADLDERATALEEARVARLASDRRVAELQSDLDELEREGRALKEALVESERAQKLQEEELRKVQKEAARLAQQSQSREQQPQQLAPAAAGTSLASQGVFGSFSSSDDEEDGDNDDGVDALRARVAELEREKEDWERERSELEAKFLKTIKRKPVYLDALVSPAATAAAGSRSTLKREAPRLAVTPTTSQKPTRGPRRGAAAGGDSGVRIPVDNKGMYKPSPSPSKKRTPYEPVPSADRSMMEALYKKYATSPPRQAAQLTYSVVQTLEQAPDAREADRVHRWENVWQKVKKKS